MPRWISEAIRLAVLAALLLAPVAATAAPARRIMRVALPGGTMLGYYIATTPASVRSILIGVQGYVRDANRTWDAAAKAVADAGHADDTLVVAPIFAVAAPEAQRCQYHGVPEAAPGDALWHCGNWSGGAPAGNDPRVTSFTAMDTLIAALAREFPTARRITVAGFSAGGQYVQRYAAFAAPPPAGVHLRFVVADPSSFLYFDPERPQPGIAACPSYNRWKFGTEALPPFLGRSAAAARATYADADLSYLEGSLDRDAGPGTAYRNLARNCAAELQGPFRLQRGLAYAAYDKAKLAHGAHPLTIVPGCAHSVSCVFPAPAARAALFGN